VVVLTGLWCFTVGNDGPRPLTTTTTDDGNGAASTERDLCLHPRICDAGDDTWIQARLVVMLWWFNASLPLLFILDGDNSSSSSVGGKRSPFFSCCCWFNASSSSIYLYPTIQQTHIFIHPAARAFHPSGRRTTTLR